MSFRKAVNNKCRDCIHDKANLGNFVQQVSMCPQMDCPLWEIRPVSQRWRKSVPLHDKDAMQAWRDMSADEFYRNAQKACGEST